jgi:flagellar motor switch protein FliN
MADPTPNPSPPPSPPQGEPPAANAESMAESALDAAEEAVTTLQRDTEPVPFEAATFERPAGDGPAKGLDLLADVNLNVKIELGRTRMLVEDVLKLSEGAVVELDKLAGDPVDVYVNDRHIARGEVLVLNDNFCVRINEIIPNSDAEGPPKRRPA